MAKQLYVNLPVKDLPRSVEFFTALGFGFNPDYTDENATCMIVNDDAFVMLLVEPFFASFLPADASQGSGNGIIMSYSVDSREAVDDTVSKALAAGGQESQEAKDYGFMYSHSFRDPDGHIWEVMWLDPAGAPTEMPAPE